MITEEILQQMKVVRDSGKANMFSRPQVMMAANELRQYALVIWLTNNGKRYANLLTAFQEYLKAE